MKYSLIKTVFAILFALNITWNLSAQKNLNDSIKKNSFIKQIKGNIKLAFSNVNGNIVKQDLKYGAKIYHSGKKNYIAIKSNGMYGEKGEDNDVYQRNFDASIIDIISFTDNNKIYLKLSYYTNEFKGYNNQYKTGVGYLRNWIKKNNNTLSTRIGYQYRYTETIGTDDIIGYKNQNIGLLGARASFDLMQNVIFSTEINYTSDFKDNTNKYYIDGNAKITFKVNKYVDLSIKYKVNYSNSPLIKNNSTGELYKTTDTFFDTILVIKF